ncbi:MAG TPA: cytochrome c biogenesis protein CcdA [Bacillota bacterium]|nr:cytochrome c biogenesis protein CcdA [Bacillota bacterium]
MFLLFSAFVAGVLTVLAPCVLPLLPIIIGGSLSGDQADRKRPLIITLSLAVSLIVSTLLLKATTLLVHIPPRSIAYISGSLIILLGIALLFPLAYAVIMSRLGVEQKAQGLLGQGYRNKSWLGPLVIGVALGPVFSSCSPVYAYILASVLPANFAQAFVYIVSYVLGLSALLLLIGYYGQRLVARIRFASNPNGWFQRTIAILFIVVGLLVFTGYDKQFQVWVTAHTPFKFDGINARLLPVSKHKIKSATPGQYTNVEPYAAPEFTGIDNWINSEPLRMRDLRGKVVLVDFWTYSCINCIRNNPYIERWYNAYKDDGLVVIGVHAPEFSFEKVAGNVAAAVKEQGITYPVALDNSLSTWAAFDNRSWPASYLINSAGQVVRLHEGEGEYAEEEQAIRALLAQNGAHLGPATTGASTVPISSAQTPETYLGSDRAQFYGGTPDLLPSESAAGEQFTLPATLPADTWALGGKWNVIGQSIAARGSDSVLRIHVAAKDVYLVGGIGAAADIAVFIDGKPINQTNASGADVVNGVLHVDEPRLYKVVSFPSFTSDAILELRVPFGVQLNAFTFGS